MMWGIRFRLGERRIVDFFLNLQEFYHRGRMGRS